MKKQFGRYTVTLSNLTKPLLGRYTKGDIIAYYKHIAPTMVPYTKNHPLMMHRFPDGLKGESFYQKDSSAYFPDWIQRVPIEKKDGSWYTAVLAQNSATLVYLANQACITPHLWLSRADKLNIPDRIIFDLDPSTKKFTAVLQVALALKQLLDSLGLRSFVMTSGSRGLHIYVPLRRKADFITTKAFATSCAEQIVANHPTLATLELRKEQRGTKVFIDVLRNQKGATSVAPYAIRAKENAPIATPIEWSLVEEPTLDPQQFTIDKQPTSDAWKDYFSVRQTLTTAEKKLEMV